MRKTTLYILLVLVCGTLNAKETATLYFHLGNPPPGGGEHQIWGHDYTEGVTLLNYVITTPAGETPQTSFTLELRPGNYHFFSYYGGNWYAWAVNNVTQSSALEVKAGDTITALSDYGGVQAWYLPGEQGQALDAFWVGLGLAATVLIFRACLRWFKRAGTENWT